MNIEGQSSVQRIYAVTSINNKKRSMRAVNNAASLLRKVSHFAHSHPQSVTHKPQSFLALTVTTGAGSTVHCHSLTHSLTVTHSHSLTLTLTLTLSQLVVASPLSLSSSLLSPFVRSNFELRTSNFELLKSNFQLPTFEPTSSFFLLAAREGRKMMFVCMSVAVSVDI